jgi:hypothetical protein
VRLRDQLLGRRGRGELEREVGQKVTCGELLDDLLEHVRASCYDRVGVTGQHRGNDRFHRRGRARSSACSLLPRHALFAFAFGE